MQSSVIISVIIIINIIVNYYYYYYILVKYGTRPVRDVVIMQYYGEIRHPFSQGCCYNAIL